jgi:rhodanese-related sulfurtransferase
MDDSGGKETIDVDEARTRMGTDLTVLDIRSDEEWQSVGNIPGAISAADRDPQEAVKQIDEESTVVVVCEDGERSAEIAGQLREAGRDAVSLEGGMEAWADKDMPMQPTEDPALPSEPGSADEEDGAGG